MDNPYFEEVYPVIKPERFNPNNYGLPIFRPDSILTAEQLNLLFGFLLIQEQRTRTRLIGVGVVCGLKPTLNADSSITITDGYGVTTDGDLLNLEASEVTEAAKTRSTRYTHFADYTLADHISYQPFQDINSLKIWELIPETTESDPGKPSTVNQPVLLDLFNRSTNLLLSEMVVVLYLESEAKSADKCTGVACDSKGKLFQNKLRVLLVEKTNAAKLISNGLRQSALARTVLPVLTIPRWQLTSTVNADKTLAHHIEVILKTLKKSSQLINDIADLQSLKLNKLESLLPLLATRKPTLPAPNPFDPKLPDTPIKIDLDLLQYVYDWIRDLVDAYNEFREATAHWLVQCMPPKEVFPKHLLLGELAPTTCMLDYRHAWLRSPAVAEHPEARQRAIFYYERLGKMIDLFWLFGLKAISKEDSELLKKKSIDITPDHYRFSPIDQRAIPFYYYPSIRKFWSYERTKYCQAEYIQSYYRPKSEAAEIENPFSYQIETYPFYRIEGLLGKGITEVLNTLVELRKTYNLAFEIVPLRADSAKLVLGRNSEIDFNDLTVDFENIMSDIHCHEAEVSAGDGKIDPLNVVLQMNPNQFKKILGEYRVKLNKFEKQPPARCILDKLSLLPGLNEAFLRRQSVFQASQVFGNFLNEHPGLEHGAGVPKGGTFIVVYADPERSTSGDTQTVGGDSIVVADYYLPYMCSGKGTVVQFVLSEPPPTLQVKTKFCQMDEPGEIVVSPVGGQFTIVDASGKEPNDVISKQLSDGKLVFVPIHAGQFRLTYSLDSRPPVSATIQVLALSTASFISNKLGENEVLFTYTYSDAAELVFDYGDGSQPERIAVNGNGNGRIQHSFPLKKDGSGQFTVKLTTTNGNCDQAKPATQEIVFEPGELEPLILDAGPIVCFSKETKLRASANPRGGEFSSDSIRITPKTGDYVPNVEGSHILKYTLENQVAKVSIFVLPETFVIENVKVQTEAPNPPTHLIVFQTFEVVILTPVESIFYQWSVDDVAIQPISKTQENNKTRFKFKKNGQSSRQLTLQMFIKQTPICEVKTVLFSQQ